MDWVSEELEKVICDYCCSVDYSHVFTRLDGLDVVECDHCGLCFVNPRPRMEVILKLYCDGYFTDCRIPVDQASDVGTRGMRRPYCDRRYDLVNTAHKRLGITGRFMDVRGKKCLEIGCATGEFCKVLSDKGATATGIDLSEYAVSVAKARYPSLEFQNVTVDQLPDEANFDVIFAFELVEHLHSPSIFFANIRRLLTERGHLVITTPNYDNGKSVGLQHWNGFKTSFEHLYFFSPGTLMNYGDRYSLSAKGWYTGEGTGLVESRRSGFRSISRWLLHRVGLLGLAKQLSRRLANPVGDYIEFGDKYNLFMAFSARDEPG